MHTLTTQTCLWVLLLFSSVGPGRGLGAPNPQARKGEEVRAIWVSRWDYVSAFDIRTLVNNCVALGLNRIYFQVRGQADAFYRSSFEPWGEELRGDPKRNGDPGFDPLQTAIEAAREAAVELFAWVNVLPGWKGEKLPRSKRHLVHTHPEWFVRDRRGRRPLVIEERYTILNPCLPAVRAHLVAVIGEIVQKYPVGGIQLDYIRFLARNLDQGEDVPYDASTLALFRRLHGSAPTAVPRAWDRFRKQAVDDLVEELATAIRRANPEVPISVAAVMNLERARRHLFQDVPKWVREGWVDEVCPMMYTPSRRPFMRLLESWRRVVSRRQIVAGVGVYKMSEGSQLKAQIDAVRDASVAGYSLFSYASYFLSRSPLCSRAPDAAEVRARMRKVMRVIHPTLKAPPAWGRRAARRAGPFDKLDSDSGF